jgi:DNA-binding NtrC family response regulator
VRELENICERAAVLTPGSVIEAATIQPWLCARVLDDTGAESKTTDKTLEEIEREVIIRTLGRFDGHRQRTAEQLGIGVRTLGLKLKKWKEENLVASSL